MKKNIIDISKKYIGCEASDDNNTISEDYFRKALKAAGWIAGDRACRWFAKIVWLELFSEDKVISKAIRDLFVYSRLQTVENLKQSELFEFSQTPTVGAYGVYSNGEESIGVIVTEVLPDRVLTVEMIPGRKCLTVARFSRKLDQAANLNLVGFFYPKTQLF